MRHLARVVCALLLVGGAAHAQTCHSLTGSWRLDLKASLMGSGLSFNPTYAVTAIQLDLDQTTDGSIRQTWRISGPHISEIDSYGTQPDGLLHSTGLKSLLDSTPDAVQTRWLNCTLTVNARSHLFGQEIWTLNSYIVDLDGQRLTIDQTSHSDIGDVERHLVFHKDGR